MRGRGLFRRRIMLHTNQTRASLCRCVEPSESIQIEFSPFSICIWNLTFFLRNRMTTKHQRVVYGIVVYSIVQTVIPESPPRPLAKRRQNVIIRESPKVSRFYSSVSQENGDGCILQEGPLFSSSSSGLSLSSLEKEQEESNSEDHFDSFINQFKASFSV